MRDENKNKMTRRDMIKAMGLTAGAVGLAPALGQVSSKEKNMAADKATSVVAAAANQQTDNQAGAIPPVDEGD